MDSHTRSIVKAISWRIIATILTLAVAYGMTHTIGASVELTAVVMIASTVLYYFHERVWAGIAWGRKRVS